MGSLWRHPAGGQFSPSANPKNLAWLSVSALYSSFSESAGSPDLLTSLALGRVMESPFDPAAVKELREEAVRSLTAEHLLLSRELGIESIRRPTSASSQFTSGSGARLPRLPALYPKKKMASSRARQTR